MTSSTGCEHGQIPGRLQLTLRLDRTSTTCRRTHTTGRHPIATRVAGLEGARQAAVTDTTDDRPRPRPQDVADARAVPRDDLLHAPSRRGDRGAGAPGRSTYFALAGRPARARCRPRWSSPPSSTSTPPWCARPSPQRLGDRHARATLVAARFRAADAALRDLLGDDATRVAGDGRGRRAGPSRRRGVPARGAAAVRGPRVARRGPTSPTSCCGTPSPCCASTAATATSPRWSSEGLDACESLVTHGAAADNPIALDVLQASRAWPDAEWNAARQRLTDRGWLDGDALTDAGAAVRQRIEDADRRAGDDAVDSPSAPTRADRLRGPRPAVEPGHQRGRHPVQASSRQPRPARTRRLGDSDRRSAERRAVDDVAQRPAGEVGGGGCRRTGRRPPPGSRRARSTSGATATRSGGPTAGCRPAAARPR